MAMPVAERRWTAQLVRELPDDGNRYEVVDGVLLVTPAPVARHQLVLQRLFVALHDYLRTMGRGESILWSPADISWAEDVLVQPDVFVVEPSQVTSDWTTYQTLPLIIEALSPGTRRADRGLKRAAYQRYGVATYWIVDYEARTVEVWHPGDAEPAVVTDVLRWQVTPEAPVLEVPLAGLFDRLPR